MKYRIKHIEGVGFFAQVRLGRGIFSEWVTITPRSLKLYSEDYEEYPEASEAEAEAIITKYIDVRISKKITYRDIKT
jgi:hypothetical protein